jgi:hypothetical protein
VQETIILPRTLLRIIDDHQRETQDTTPHLLLKEQKQNETIEQEQLLEMIEITMTLGLQALLLVLMEMELLLATGTTLLNVQTNPRLLIALLSVQIVQLIDDLAMNALVMIARLMTEDLIVVIITILDLPMIEEVIELHPTMIIVPLEIQAVILIIDPPRMIVVTIVVIMIAAMIAVIMIEEMTIVRQAEPLTDHTMILVLIPLLIESEEVRTEVKTEI